VPTGTSSHAIEIQGFIQTLKYWFSASEFFIAGHHKKILFAQFGRMMLQPGW
jgi:hypothetical protein